MDYENDWKAGWCAFANVIILKTAAYQPRIKLFCWFRILLFKSEIFNRFSSKKRFKFEWTMNPSNPPEYKIQTHPLMIFYLKYIGRWLTKTCERPYEQKKLIIMLHLCCALMLDTPVLYCHRRLSKLNIDCHVCLPNLQINSSEHNSHS